MAERRAPDPLSSVPYIQWAKAQVGKARYPLTMSAVPPVDWQDLDFDPRELALFEFSDYGDPELRDGIAGEWGWTREHVCLASSASHAHFCFAASVLEPGDTVLYESPGYLPLLDSLSLLRVETVPVSRRSEDGFALDLDAVREAVARTGAKVLLITDLHNPSGVALPDDVGEGLAQLCDETGLQIIVDEMYRPFLEEDPRPLCGDHPNIVSIRGLNKVHGLSQIRIGWGLASPDRVARAQRILDATTIHNSCLTDQVGRVAWRVRESLVARARRIAGDGWDVVRPWLDEGPLEGAPPAGGLVCFPRLPEGWTGTQLFEAARARDVLVTPGSFFGDDRHIRLGFGLPPKELRAALTLLDEVLSGDSRASLP